MTKEEFVSQLERGALSAGALPVTSALLRWTADQLKRGEPAWWKPIAKAWEKRVFVAWTEAWSLYLTCLHFEALSDAECELVPYFPSCGGTAEADPSVALARFLADPPPTFFENLKAGHRRTYIAGRAIMWTAPAMLFFQRRDLPYYLVEVNSGAGLNLAADQITAVKGFDSALISARVGLEARPLQAEDIADRRWLTAGIWPDNLAAIAELDAALDKVAQRTREEAAFIQLAPCPPEKAAAFVTKNIPSDDPEVGLLIFNMGTTVRMSDAAYAAYAADMVAMLRAWGERGLWVEVESVRGETYSMTTQLRVHRILGGQLRSLVMASIDLESSAHQYSEASAAFLGPEITTTK
ncbi:MAG: DUF2332 domain-containing protein [Elusimicrobia bacterium]|nr:DUF2332 domain-containing protein [Elusimicrobiota bacterium]